MASKYAVWSSLSQKIQKTQTTHNACMKKEQRRISNLHTFPFFSYLNTIVYANNTMYVLNIKHLLVHIFLRSLSQCMHT